MREHLAQRFWSKVDTRGGPEGCWPWMAAKVEDGYGVFCVPGKRSPSRAHRVAFALANGELPDGGLVLHDCDNRACVNPAHLHVGTHEDNMRERTARHRMPASRGKYGPRLDEEQRIEIIAARGAGATVASICGRYGVSRSTIQRLRRAL